MRISRISVLAAILGLCVAESKERKQRSGDGYYYPRGTPGGWDSRNGVQSFGWDSRRPTNPCTRCSQTLTDNYRGNGYDNLSPEWQQQKEAKPWRPGYEDKRVWSGTIRPIENPYNDQRYDERWDRPGGMVTNWMGGPSRWETYQRRDPWDKGYQQPDRNPSYYGSSNPPSHGSGYAGGYGYNDDRYSGRGYTRPYDSKNPVYYDRSRGESGYISRYDYNYQPWEETMRGWGGWGVKNYATNWDYERPSHGYGGYHMRVPPSSFTPLAPPYPDPWTERGPQNRPGVGTWTRPYEKPVYNERRPDYYDYKQPWRDEYRPDYASRPDYSRPDMYRPDGYRPEGYQPYRPDDYGYRPAGEDRYRPGDDRYSPGGDRYGYRPDDGYGYPYERPSRPGGDYGGSQGTDHKLDRYPGHTGVGATYDFYGSRDPGSYHYDRPTTSSTPTTTDRSTSGLSSTSSSTTT